MRATLENKPHESDYELLLRIILLRIRDKIRDGIAEEQCGLVKRKGTANALYIMRTIAERATEVQKDLYVCFIDYTKAFDTIRHDELMKLLQALNLDGKNLRIIKKLC